MPSCCRKAHTLCDVVFSFKLSETSCAIFSSRSSETIYSDIVSMHRGEMNEKLTSRIICSSWDLLPMSARASRGMLRTMLRRLSICVTREDATLADVASRASDAASYERSASARVYERVLKAVAYRGYQLVEVELVESLQRILNFVEALLCLYEFYCVLTPIVLSPLR